MREDAPGETGVEPAGEKEPLLKIKSELLGRRRQERFRSLTDIARRRHILELFVIFSLLMVANIGAMMYFEGYALEDAAWLTLTTVTRVGFGDLSPVTAPGRIAVVLLLYGFGIFLLAQIVGEWIDQRLDRRDRMQRGIWRWHMKNHILVLNTPDTQGAVYLRLLVEQVRATPTLGDCPIQVFSPRFPDGLPADIASLDVRLRTGRPEGHGALADLDVEKASFIVLLAINSSDPQSDSVTLDVLDQLRSYEVRGHVIAECVVEANRQRLEHHGAGAVIRPIRAYPELLVRTMAAPGTEAIIEDLIVHAGNHPCRYDIEFENQLWGELASRLLMQGLGTPLGFLDAGGRMVTNPAPDIRVSGKALFLMVSHNAPLRPGLVAACITRGS